MCVAALHTLQSAMESGQEAGIVMTDFSATFDRVNHQGILYKLCSVGIEGSVLSILTQFQSNQSHNVMVDGCRTKLVNVVSGVPQGSVFGPLMFILYTSELFSILENMLIGYAGDSTLIAIVPSLGVKVRVAESLSRDLVKVSEWCDFWHATNESKTKTRTKTETKTKTKNKTKNKTKTKIVSRSRTMHPQSPALTIVGTVLKESDDLVI